MTLPLFAVPLLLDAPMPADEVLVPGADIPATGALPGDDAAILALPEAPPAAGPVAPAAPVPAASPAPADGAPPAAIPAPPPDPHPAPPPEDAFPTLAELDAILAAHAGPPPGPDAATRLEVAAWLGLDPSLSGDPSTFDAALAGVPTPDADATLLGWLSDEAEAFLDRVAAREEWPLG